MKAKEGMDGAGQEGALKKLGMSFKKKALSSERKSLTLKQKLKIANAEFEALQSMNQKEKSRLEEEIIAVRCELQLNDLQLKDLKKEAFEFKRDVVLASQGKEPSSQQETFPDEAVAVDKLLRFMETKEKQVKKKITKLSTKNDTLKAAINRLNHTLKSKETHHDGLHYIDFFQLQIENKQYAGKIEGKNAEVLQMKHKAAMLTLKFNRMKDELAEACLFSEQLKTKQKSIRGLMKKTELVVKQVTAEVEQEKLMMDGLQNHVLNNQAPTIAQYMEEKRMLKELETKINNLERKIDIVSIRQGSGSGSPDVKAVR